jgi:hypothetical protein
LHAPPPVQDQRAGSPFGSPPNPKRKVAPGIPPDIGRRIFAAGSVRQRAICGEKRPATVNSVDIGDGLLLKALQIKAKIASLQKGEQDDQSGVD